MSRLSESAMPSSAPLRLARLRAGVLAALPPRLGTWLKWAALEGVAGFALIRLLAPDLAAWRFALALCVLPVLFDFACRRVAYQIRRL